MREREIATLIGDVHHPCMLKGTFVLPATFLALAGSKLTAFYDTLLDKSVHNFAFGIFFVNYEEKVLKSLFQVLKRIREDMKETIESQEGKKKESLGGKRVAAKGKEG